MHMHLKHAPIANIPPEGKLQQQIAVGGVIQLKKSLKYSYKCNIVEA